MIPTLQNIDQWLFDSLEGNLSPEQQELLAQFIAQHPELEQELEAWSRSSFEAKPLTFEPKSALYRKKEWRYKPIAAAALLLLLLGTTLLYNAYNKTAINQGHHAKSVIKNTRQTTSRTTNSSSIETSTAISNLGHSESSTILLNPFSSISSSINSNSTFIPSANEISSGLYFASHHNSTTENLNASSPNVSSHFSSIGSTNILPILSPSKITGYRTDMRFESLAGISAELNSANMTRFPTIQNISQFAQKELGLSNNQSYDLLLPGKSNIDANISSVGTLSQIRFQSMSLARTSTDIAQGLIGQQISLDAYARKMRSGIGIQGTHKQYAGGAVSDYELGLIAAPKIALTRQIILEPAARLRMGARFANANKLQELSYIEFENADLREVQIDSSQSVGRRLFYKDLDLSLAIQTHFFFASAQLENAFSHFDYVMGNEQSPSNSSAAKQLTFALGTQYASRNEKLRFSPYFLFTSNRLQTQIYGGAQINLNKWQFGMSVSNNKQYQASLGYFGNHSAVLIQSTQQQLLTLNAPSYLHQITLRIYSPNSRQARRYISL